MSSTHYFAATVIYAAGLSTLTGTVLHFSLYASRTQATVQNAFSTYFVRMAARQTLRIFSRKSMDLRDSDYCLLLDRLRIWPFPQVRRRPVKVKMRKSLIDIGIINIGIDIRHDRAN